VKQIVIKNLPEALKLIKEMKLASPREWAGTYRDAAKSAIATVLREEMETLVGRRLSWAYRKGIQDRRNGTYQRHVLTELGDVLLSIPRTRHFSPKGVITAYARRSREVDDLILASFLLGLSTRKVGHVLSVILHERISAQTVSRVAKTLDGAVAAFHRRRLSDRYRALILDGVMIRRKTGVGALTRPVLVALGLRYDGRKEIIDFRCVASESGPAWETFLTDLMRRGLTGEYLDVICADGGQGLLSVLPLCYPHVPLQRCWAHKMRNIMNKIRKGDQKKAKSGLIRIYTAASSGQARYRAKRWIERWEGIYPKAVKCLQDDIDDLLTCFAFPDPDFRKAIRTTNAIERRFREVRRRTRPMGVMSDRTSMERILYAIFMNENISAGVYPVFSLTQNT
jgi:transposase-like protein